MWRFEHVKKQTCCYCQDVSSAEDTQTTRDGRLQEKVIAIVANVAAFDLCGSSQNVGTEVNSS